VNDKGFSPPHVHVIWDSDGSLDGVIGLLYFLQHPNVSVEALTISCGEAYPDIYAAYLPRMLARLVHLGVNKPTAIQHPEPVERCGFAQVSRLDPHPSTSSGC
jgi:inosine-uridine nucleoside N-ribohydrolase